MEETLNGFKATGSWYTIVEHGEKISEALVQVDADDFDFDVEGCLEEWNDWRPKHSEPLQEVNRKTAEKASVLEGEGEKKGHTVDDDMKKASEKLTESYERMEEQDTKGAFETWVSSFSYFTRAADTAFRKFLRTFEGTIYKRVMTKISPYYFDNELISANLNRVRENDFAFEVNINNDDIQSELQTLFDEEFDDDRWHSSQVDSSEIEADTDTLEQVEGFEGK